MCGIFGYVGEHDNGAQLVLNGLKQLEYRGYDSWGIAVRDGAHAAIDRRVGKIGEATTALPSSRIGLGHTRWATHGGVTRDNAHPQLDCTQRLALVHNGMLANDVTLRAALMRGGHELRSQTDSELIVHLIEDLLERMHGTDRLLRATIEAFRKLEGLNAIAVMDVESGVIAAAKNGSPLIVGIAELGQLLASDHSALLEHTHRLVFVDDGQAVLVDGERARLFEIDSGRELTLDVSHVERHANDGGRGTYRDYMTKEIHEQPALLRSIANNALAHTQELAARIDQAAQVFMIGCGSAAHAALAGQQLFARIAGRRVHAASASEFIHLAQFVNSGTLVCALSQSGETIDVLDAVRTARARGAQVAALTNVEGSALSRLADFTVPLNAGPERCVLATKSLTAKLALLLLTAATLEGRPNVALEAIRGAADELAAMLAGKRRSIIQEIASAIQAHEHLFVLGRGSSHTCALETALKIKEVSYIHAEGFAGGDLKHGVMALIEPGTPCIVLAPHDETHADMIGSTMQVKARGAVVIGIAPEPHPAFDHHIEVADLGDATLILNAIPGQLLGYDLARLRGHDPDMPRNLAKSVTVK